MSIAAGKGSKKQNPEAVLKREKTDDIYDYPPTTPPLDHRDRECADTKEGRQGEEVADIYDYPLSPLSPPSPALVNSDKRETQPHTQDTEEDLDDEEGGNIYDYPTEPITLRDTQSIMKCAEEEELPIVYDELEKRPSASGNLHPSMSGPQAHSLVQDQRIVKNEQGESYSPRILPKNALQSELRKHSDNSPTTLPVSYGDAGPVIELDQQRKGKLLPSAIRKVAQRRAPNYEDIPPLPPKDIPPQSPKDIERSPEILSVYGKVTSTGKEKAVVKPTGEPATSAAVTPSRTSEVKYKVTSTGKETTAVKPSGEQVSTGSVTFSQSGEAKYDVLVPARKLSKTERVQEAGDDMAYDTVSSMTAILTPNVEARQAPSPDQHKHHAESPQTKTQHKVAHCENTEKTTSSEKNVNQTLSSVPTSPKALRPPSPKLKPQVATRKSQAFTEEPPDNTFTAPVPTRRVRTPSSPRTNSPTPVPKPRRHLTETTTPSSPTVRTSKPRAHTLERTSLVEVDNNNSVPQSYHHHHTWDRTRGGGNASPKLSSGAGGRKQAGSAPLVAPKPGTQHPDTAWASPDTQVKNINNHAPGVSPKPLRSPVVGPKPRQKLNGSPVAGRKTSPPGVRLRQRNHSTAASVSASESPPLPPKPMLSKKKSLG